MHSGRPGALPSSRSSAVALQRPCAATPGRARFPLPTLSTRPHLPTSPCSLLLQLYERLGYQEVGRDPVFTPNRRCLMRKEVEPCHAPSNNIVSSGGTIRANGSSSGGGKGGGGGGASSRKSGVFIWSEEIEV